MKTNKKIILIDLDGVLNTYTGTYNEVIPPLKTGALEFLQLLSTKYKIKIFTSRNLLKTARWIIDNNLINYIDDITNIKEPSYLLVDDRCINFEGNYNEIIEKISQFNPWYKMNK